ncbi:unnamed protein product [Trichobilharzia szidati]|nr:unnamed protein product [Trichobilharzia szidati]
MDNGNPTDYVLLHRTKSTPTAAEAAATTTTNPKSIHIYSTPSHRTDSNDIHHHHAMMDTGSYFRISEDQKAALKNRKSDFCDTVRRYLNRQNQQYCSDCQIIPETLPYTRKVSGVTINHDKMHKRKKSVNANKINRRYSTNWYNKENDNEIGQALETLRDSVSRKRKQWLSDQINKLNTERTTTIGCSHDDEIYAREEVKAENQDLPSLINTEMLDSVDTDNYITNTLNDQNVSLYNYDKNPTNMWRNYALCSANTRFRDNPETSPSYKMYRIMNDVHKPSLHTEQSKMDSNHHYDNLNKQKPSGHKKSTRYPESYQERYTSNSQIEKKIPKSQKIKKTRTLSTPIEAGQFKKIEEQIIDYLTSDNWEEQNKATNIIQSLLKTMNVKPLEVIFSDIKQRSILINGIEKSIRCLRSQVCRNGLNTLYQLCDYLKCLHQGCLLDAYSTSIITTLLSRISEDSSTKFLQNEANRTLEAYISCIDEASAIQSMCSHVWENFSRSNIRRNTIGKMLTYIFCNKLQTGKKNAMLFKRLGSDGIERLMKVVHQLVNDKLSDTRQYGRRILERLTLITDIDEVYKKILSYENHT